MRAPLGFVILALCVALLGCGSSQARGSYSDQGMVQRDIPRAQELYQQSRAQRDSGDFDDAADLLRQALDADLYHGPAHNDLGVILLSEGRLYEAATEFEWARKLMPGHPDPRVNLAVTLERGFKHAEALEAAQAALEVRPGHLAAHQAIAIIQCRNNLVDESTTEHLAVLVDRGPTDEWRRWAETWQLKIEGRQRQP
ncbi:MAG: tetratricopeptide repeat protein [Planctomycetota bacterium]|jgi:tetratricopeptide (TPR) repeat protein|nr:tetratricopeptide repeat protein [Planctomycetota bacterium]